MSENRTATAVEYFERIAQRSKKQRARIMNDVKVNVDNSRDDFFTGENIAKAAIALAETEAAIVTAEGIISMLRREGLDKTLAMALSELCIGAGDSWSGRANDVARAKFDGVRATYRELQYL